MRPLVVLAILAACAPPDAGRVVAPAGDVAAYQRDVHAILEARCATLDCHGAPGRPLRLYAETGLRAADELRDTPITAAELEGNVRAILAVDPAPATIDAHALLAKPLGELAHVGEILWPARDDPQAVCVRGWLAGASDTAAVAAACAVAAEQVRLPDP